MIFKHGLLFSVVLLIVMISCEKSENSDYSDLNNLPEDTGGEQVAFPYLSTPAAYGHYAYLPGGYESTKANYPLIVFLHGAGEKGNSSVNPLILDMVLRNGPPKLIENGTWDPPYPCIVISPQCHEGGWNANKIHELIGYVTEIYRINEKRIYLTGLSMGGFGTFSYLQTYSDTGYVAAAVPICGGGNPSRAERLVNIPLWAFHGESDNTVLPIKSIEMVEAINSYSPPVKARLTMYPGVGHNSWSMTYDGTGMGKESDEYDPFDMDIFDWMFRYSK